VNRIGPRTVLAMRYTERHRYDAKNDYTQQLHRWHVLLNGPTTDFCVQWAFEEWDH
jgi:hypothetical protein